MNAENQNIRLIINVSELQLNTITNLFNHNDWVWSEINQDTQLITTSTQCDEQHLLPEVGDVQPANGKNAIYPNFHIAQDESQDECPYCYCRPCITNERNRQLWWEDENAEPNHTNTGLRKEKYKRFWTMMHHRNVWEDERYKSKKREALKRDPRCKKYEWHRREIMPKCVLDLVRQWLPNPSNIPYMGHLWE